MDGVGIVFCRGEFYIARLVGIIVHSNDGKQFYAANMLTHNGIILVYLAGKAEESQDKDGRKPSQIRLVR